MPGKRRQVNEWPSEALSGTQCGVALRLPHTPLEMIRGIQIGSNISFS